MTDAPSPISVEQATEALETLANNAASEGRQTVTINEIVVAMPAPPASPVTVDWVKKALQEAQRLDRYAMPPSNLDFPDSYQKQGDTEIKIATLRAVSIDYLVSPFLEALQHEVRDQNLQQRFAPGQPLATQPHDSHEEDIRTKQAQQQSRQL